MGWLTGACRADAAHQPGESHPGALAAPAREHRGVERREEGRGPKEESFRSDQPIGRLGIEGETNDRKPAGVLGRDAAQCGVAPRPVLALLRPRGRLWEVPLEEGSTRPVLAVCGLRRKCKEHQRRPAANSGLDDRPGAKVMASVRDGRGHCHGVPGGPREAPGAAARRRAKQLAAAGAAVVRGPLLPGSLPDGLPPGGCTAKAGVLGGAQPLGADRWRGSLWR
mmetsp:Transcript_90190/g.215418  ORF Transcript_90190/g.215418 Transcript_90190/m.215418 type:complete len:224 (+) Transcript_90190:428-1099(+)